MPIYEFRCRSCSEDFEELILNGREAVCPRCGSPRLERLMSAASTRAGSPLPIAAGCPPADAPLCGPGCCRAPAR